MIYVWSLSNTLWWSHRAKSFPHLPIIFCTFVVKDESSVPKPFWNLHKYLPLWLVRTEKKIREDRKNNWLSSTVWCTEAATQRCSMKKMFWKYAANLQENNQAEVWGRSCQATLLKSHFCMVVLL